MMLTAGRYQIRQMTIEDTDSVFKLVNGEQLEQKLSKRRKANLEDVDDYSPSKECCVKKKYFSIYDGEIMVGAISALEFCQSILDCDISVVGSANSSDIYRSVLPVFRKWLKENSHITAMHFEVESRNLDEHVFECMEGVSSRGHCETKYFYRMEI